MRVSGWIKLNLFGLVVAALFSFPFIGVGLYEIYKVRQWQSRFVRTSGIVIGNSYSRNVYDEGAYYPIVEFETGGGKTRFTDGVGSLPPDYPVGTRLIVFYNPENPQEARVYSWKRVWFAPALFIFIGLLPMLIPLGFILVGQFFLNRNSKSLSPSVERL